MSTPAPPIFRYLPSRSEEIALLVTIPHSGTYVPPDIAARFAASAMGEGTMADWHLHELYSFLPQLGIDVICATHHRFVVDLNRPPNAAPLYPGRFETGLVPTQTFQGEAIWRTPPDAAEVDRRLSQFHRPYHQAVERRLREKIREFGRCYLVDAHSVESRASRLHERLQKDIYLGDRDGMTCDEWFTQFVRELLEARGLKVSLNHPYKGGYTTAHYGTGGAGAMEGLQALQIEMCQHLYMKEGEPQGAPTQPRFREFATRLQSVFEGIAEAIRAQRSKC